MREKIYNRGWYLIVLLTVLITTHSSTMAQSYRSQKKIITSGQILRPDSVSVSSSDPFMLQGKDSISDPKDELADSIVKPLALKDTTKNKKFAIFSDSTSLTNLTLTSAVLPGYGQIYNKQYWKLPVIYTALGSSIALYVNENRTYRPLKAAFDASLVESLDRTDKLDALQTKMIHSNTRRQVYLGAAITSYIYALTDAVINYSTNDISDVTKATTLSMVCPGAGQIYNKSYWKLPLVVGGAATMVFVIDWNNRGYTRFKTAYTLRYQYDADPDKFPNGSPDEFKGRYSASYLKSLRDSYRRNRDYSVIISIALYAIQAIDAHVDAHLKDFDISDDLSMNLEPTVNYTYIASQGTDMPTFGLNLSLKF